MQQEQDLARLLNDLSGGDEWLAIDAAKALGELGDARAIEPLLKALDYNSRQAKFDRFVEEETERSSKNLRGVSALVEHMGGDITQIRAESARALGKIGDKAAVPALIDVVRSDNDLWVRCMAVWALGELRAEEAIPALSKVLASNEAYYWANQKHLYDYIMECLLKIATPEALEISRRWREKHSQEGD